MRTGEKKCRLFFKQQKRGKMMYFLGLKFSPAGTRKLDHIIVLPRKTARGCDNIPKKSRMA
jgi:hypothetical protein